MPSLVVFSREFILDLCDGEDRLVTETLYFCTLRAYIPAITPTVGHTLVDMASIDQNTGAMHALLELGNLSHVLKAPPIPPLKNGYADIAAKQIQEELDLPESKRNLTLIIAEASVLEAKYIVLDDAELDGLDVQKINHVLAGKGLAPLHFFNRMEFYGFVSGQRA